MGKNNYSHILKYTGLFGGVQGLTILISLVRTKLVALILGPQGMGLLSLFNQTVSLLSNATNLGIPTSGVRTISEAFEKGDEENLRHAVMLVRSWSLLAAAMGTLLCLIACPLLNMTTFSWGNHTLHFAVLSPVIGLMTMMGGELAVLKGLRRMRRLARISIINVVLTLVISVPIILYEGERGIVPSLAIVALFQLLVTIFYSYHIFPLRWSFNKKVLGEGTSMVRLGVAFVVASVLGSGAEFAVRSYFSYVDSLEFLGLYNAAYMMIVTYGGMVFASMDNDYFPRLSGVIGNPRVFHQTVNSQIEASLLLICPMLVVLAFFMPVVIPLLFSGKFLPIVTMAQIAVFSLYFRTLSLPMAYMNLAKGKSLAFLLLEAMSAVALVATVVVGYHHGDLLGVGYALVAAQFFDFVVTLVYVRCCFGFRLSSRVLACLLMQLPLLAGVYALMQSDSSYTYWVSCAVLLLLSTAVSVYYLLLGDNR